VSLVLGIPERPQQTIESNDASAIFRWAGARAARARRVRHVGVWLQAPLEDYGMPPTVAKIVCVDDLCANAGKHLIESHFAFVEVVRPTLHKMDRTITPPAQLEVV
jgi:hypothetical protein